MRIGDRLMIATHTAISLLTHNHTYENMHFAPIVAKSVVIEDDVWIGTNVSIMPGVTIGKEAVVGAGAVVTKDVPTLEIVTGVLAKVLKYREIKHK